jgi:hypothetical protein
MTREGDGLVILTVEEAGKIGAVSARCDAAMRVRPSLHRFDYADPAWRG